MRVHTVTVTLRHAVLGKKILQVLVPEFTATGERWDVTSFLISPAFETIVPAKAKLIKFPKSAIKGKRPEPEGGYIDLDGTLADRVEDVFFDLEDDNDIE